nr:hypothetical protein 44 [bacterium]
MMTNENKPISVDKLPLVPVGGLARSGSTLLMNLLGQNPAHHVTPSSGLSTHLLNESMSWKQNVWFRAEGMEIIMPRLLNSMRHQVYGYYQEEFDKGMVVFEKNRLWTKTPLLYEKIFGEPFKMVVCVRDVREMLASMEKQWRNNPDTEMFFGPRPPPQVDTIQGRAMVWLSPKGVLGGPIGWLRNAYQIGYGPKLFVVPFIRFTMKPKKVMRELHEFFDLPPFSYDPDNVEQITKEDDTYHGAPLHQIRTCIEPIEPSWPHILPPQVADQIAKEFADINRLAVTGGRAPVPSF